MSDAQLRVLALLGATAGFEALTSANVRAIFTDPAKAGSADLGAAVGYTVGAGLLILLAAPAPGIATGLAVLVLLLAIFHQAGAISAILQGLANLTTHL